MNRLVEIETRLAEIKGLMSADNANIDELNTETDSLLEERKGLIEAEQTRQAQLADIAQGSVGTEIPTITDENKEKRTMERNSKEYRNAWLNMIRGFEVTEEEKRAFAVSGSAIATETANDIMEVVKNNAPILEKCTVVYSAAQVAYYVEGTNNDAAAHTENAAITAAADTLTKITLTPSEVVKMIQISDAVKAMSVDAFEAWIAKNLGEAIARKINATIIALFSTATSAGTTVTADNVRKLLGAVKGETTLICNQATLFGSILPLQDNAKAPIVTFSGSDAFVYGRPVLVDDNVAANTIYAANLSKVIVGMAEEATVRASYDIDTNSYKYLGVALFDAKLGYAAAVGKIAPSA